MKLSARNAVRSFVRASRVGSPSSTPAPAPLGHARDSRFGSPANGPARTFHAITRRLKKQDGKQEAEHTTPPEAEKSTKPKGKPKHHRKHTNNTSLRQVAVEAERSRAGIVRTQGNRRVIDPEADVKEITAYCAAEQYDISAAAQILRSEGYTLDPFNTNLYPQVIHIQTPPSPSPPLPSHPSGPGDIFVFPSGTLVTWNVPERLSLRLVNKLLLPAASKPHEVETEDLEYVEHPESRSSTIIGDTIVLGTNTTPHSASSSHETDADATAAAAAASSAAEASTHLALSKVAFSSGLSRSAKLSALETLFEHYFDSTKSIPTALASPALPFDRRFILSKTGELLNIRAQLNLYSELTDSLPELLWDSRSELGLELCFDKIGRVLDVSARIGTLNQRMDYATEIAAVLRERLSEKHGWTLEWYIIALIAVELVFEGFRLVKEAEERGEEARMRKAMVDVLGEMERRIGRMESVVATRGEDGREEG